MQSYWGISTDALVVSRSSARFVIPLFCHVLIVVATDCSLFFLYKTVLAKFLRAVIPNIKMKAVNRSQW